MYKIAICDDDKRYRKTISIIGANTWITQTIPQYALVKQYISDL